MTPPPRPTVFINARFLTQELTGVQRYAIELVRALDALIDEGHGEACRYAFVLLAPGGARDLGLKHLPLRRVGRLAGHLWEQLELSRYSRGHLLLSLCNTAPITKRRQIVTVHDAAVFAVPTAYSRAFRTWYRLLLPRLGSVAKKIITVSNFSKQELARYCNIPDEKLVVIHEGKEQLLRNQPDTGILTKHGLRRNAYVFAVSSMNPSKNFAALAQALELVHQPSFDMVVAGGTNPKVFQNSATSSPDQVKYLGYVSDDELRALYEHAACFVYPSLYEGFGLPPLEAMACGCPVIAARAASVPEVCGDAALYCDPYSPRDIADKILELMNDAALQRALRKKGFEQAAKFSWEKCALELVTVIRQTVTS